MKSKSLSRKFSFTSVITQSRNQTSTSEVIHYTEDYKIQKDENGFVLTLHKENKPNQKLWFSDQKLLDVYLKAL